MILDFGFWIGRSVSFDRLANRPQPPILGAIDLVGEAIPVSGGFANDRPVFHN